MLGEHTYSTVSELLVWADSHPAEAGECRRLAAELLGLSCIAEGLAQTIQDARLRRAATLECVFG